MPTYKVTDPTTGKNISITGDSPPSEEELNQIFSGVSSQQSSPGMLQRAGKAIGSAAGAVGDFILPETTQTIRDVASGDIRQTAQKTFQPMDIGAAGPQAMTDFGKIDTGDQVDRMRKEVMQTIMMNEAVGIAKPLVGKILSKAGQAVGALDEATLGIGQKLAGMKLTVLNRIAKIPKPAFKDFAESTGKNLTEALGKYLKPGMELDELTGGVANKYKGGIFKTVNEKAEKVIQDRVTKSGSDVVASVDDILKPVDELLGQIATKNVDDAGKVTYQALPGQEDTLSGLQKFAEQTRRSYGDTGLTAKDLLTIKRMGDAQIGKAIVQEEKGAAITQSKKMITNQARKILKDRFPDIADALATEQEMIYLRPILANASSSVAVGKSLLPSSFEGVSLNRPASWVKPITESKAVSNLLMGGTPSAPRILRPGLNLAKSAASNPVLQRAAAAGVVNNATASQYQNQNDYSKYMHR